MHLKRQRSCFRSSPWRSSRCSRRSCFLRSLRESFRSNDYLSGKDHMAQYELNVLDYWLIIRKRKFTIAVTAALVIVFTFALSQFLKPMPVYEASARVKFDRTSTLANLLLESLSTQTGNDLGTQSEVIRSFPVIEDVARNMNVVPADAPSDVRRSAAYLTAVYSLQQQVKAAQEGFTNIIKITALADQADEAAQIANGVAEAYRAENIK